MKTIGSMVIGSAVGFMLGAGMMMTPAGSMLGRDVKRKTGMVKRMMKHM